MVKESISAGGRRFTQAADTYDEALAKANRNFDEIYSFFGDGTTLGTVTTVDINGGTIDGATIGGATPAAGTFTTLSSTGILDITTNNTAFRLKDSAGTMIPTLSLSASNQLLFGTNSAPASNGDLIFMRASTERMRLDGTGFGIGASAPQQMLHVRNDSAGAQASGMLLQNRSATTGSAIGIAFITTTQDFSDNRYSWFGKELQGGGSNDFIWKTAIGAAPAERMRLSNAGVLTVQSDLVLATTRTPASASATGTTGTVAWDSSYMYVCTATDTWRRVAHATW